MKVFTHLISIAFGLQTCSQPNRKLKLPSSSGRRFMGVALAMFLNFFFLGQAVAQDECGVAAPLTPGVSCVATAGSNVGATQSIPAITCGIFTSSSALDVWYNFTATATAHTVTVVGAGSFDAIIDVRSGACNGTNIGCADATTGGGTETVTVGGLTIGQTYLVRVYGWAGGTGTFTICVTNPPAGPANDDCAGATNLTPGSTCTPTAGTNVAASQSIAPITCGIFTSSSSLDVWYKFTAVSTSHTVTVVGGTGFDAIIDVRSGACNGTNIGCADATTGGGTETVTVSGLTAGQVYLVRVYGWAGGTGTFTICVTTPAPANNECATATSLTPGASCVPTAGTTVGATQSIPAITCASFTGTADDDVWYQFTATAANHNVTVVGGTGFDAVVDVRSGACTGTNIGCADATVSGGTETVTLTGLTVGATYLIRVYSYTSLASGQGSFNICVTTPVSVANNECATATTLTPGTTCVPTAGTTVGATQSIPAITCATFTGTADDDVWYQFTATSANHNVTVVGGTGFDAVVDVRSGACNGTNIGCADATTSAGTETVVLTGLTAGSTYLVRVYSFGSTAGNQGTFNICVTTPTPSNNDCSTATTLTPGATCTPTAGTTIGATQSIPAITCATFTGTADDDVWYQFTATSANHNVTVVGGTGFDAVVDVRSGACDGTNIGCADATVSAGTETVVLTGLTVGATYRVRVYSFGSSASNQGTFNICVTTPAPANNECATATTLTPGTGCVPTAGTTVGATQSIPAITCATFTGTADDDVWYQFTATSANHNVTVTGGAGFDAVVDVRSGGCNGTNIGCADATVSAGTETVQLTGLTIGSTYLVRVYSFGSSASNQGTFNICVTTPGVANDDCVSGVALTSGTTCVPTAGTTINATQSLPPINCGGFNAAQAFDVWYHFTATSPNHTVLVDGAANMDAVVEVRSGSCNGTYVTCSDATTADGTESIALTGLTIGTNYSVRVYDFFSSGGDFNICILTQPPSCIASPTSPTNMLSNGCPNNPTNLVWPASTGATSYDVYFGTINPPPFVGNTASTNFSVSIPTVNTSYYWQVRPVGAGGTAAGCTVWTFFIVNGSYVLPPNGASTVACPALIVQPTPPTVVSNCASPVPSTGPTIVDAPNPITCEGTRTYTWTYNNGFGQISNWSHVTTVERNPFTVPANGAAQVACPALAVAPTPPVVTSNCGETLPAPAPVITNVPNPIACEGTRTYAYTYTDCEGNTATWSFVYTIERNPFTVPANTALQVACPSAIVQPVPPTVLSNCGETITPTGPVITNVPNPLTCEGTRTFTWTYTDCEGNSLPWSHVVTVERLPFGVPASGGSTVSCPDLTDIQPTAPVVTSNCGEVLTPVVTSTAKPGCEGNRNWNFTYTDCEGNTATWVYIYTVEYLDFTVPTNEVLTVECPLNAVEPTPPTVLDNCGKPVNMNGPIITSTDNANGCEASRTYAWTFKDCEGNTHTWSRKYNFQYTADFFLYPDGEDFVGCILFAQPPVPPTVYDNCSLEVGITGPVVTENLSGCSGWRKFTYTYTDCGGHSHPWSFTYYANDVDPPVGNCPAGTTFSVDVTDLACIEDVPCPGDYNFSEKAAELLTAGGFYDLCSGADLIVELDSWSALWECSDANGDGINTFGRTFYFRIADGCGNEYPSLCGVTYSGKCVPIETFPQGAWGNVGDEPGNDVGAATTDVQVITALLANNPLVVGGGNRSLTFTDANCVVALLPGVGNPTILANCNQINCNGCNPAGPIGMKNILASNTAALMLNMRYNVTYNNILMNTVRSQDLGCVVISPDIKVCSENGGCKLRVFESNGTVHDFPYNIGGLVDLSNLYLGGNLQLSPAFSLVYASALNTSIANVNNYFHGDMTQNAACSPSAGIAPVVAEDVAKALPTGNAGSAQVAIQLAPNPTSGEVVLKLTELVEAQEIMMTVFNSLGQEVLHHNFGTVTFVNERLDLRGLGNGLYFVNLRVGNERFERRLVIAKD